MANPTLTKKQQQVFDHAKKGETPAEIARALRISPSGVHGHLRRIRELGIEIPGREQHAEVKPVAPPNGTPGTINMPSVSDSIKRAIEHGEDRLGALTTELADLSRRGEALAKEREVLATRIEGYRKAHTLVIEIEQPVAPTEG